MAVLFIIVLRSYLVISADHRLNEHHANSFDYNRLGGHAFANRNDFWLYSKLCDIYPYYSLLLLEHYLKKITRCVRLTFSVI